MAESRLRSFFPRFGGENARSAGRSLAGLLLLAALVQARTRSPRRDRDAAADRRREALCRGGDLLGGRGAGRARSALAARLPGDARPAPALRRIPGLGRRGCRSWLCWRPDSRSPASRARPERRPCSPGSPGRSWLSIRRSLLSLASSGPRPCILRCSSRRCCSRSAACRATEGAAAAAARPARGRGRSGDRPEEPAAAAAASPGAAGAPRLHPAPAGRARAARRAAARCRARSGGLLPAGAQRRPRAWAAARASTSGSA